MTNVPNSSTDYLAAARQQLYEADRHITEAGFPAAGEANCIAAMEAAALALVRVVTGLCPASGLALREAFAALPEAPLIPARSLALIGGSPTSGRAYGVLADPSDVRRAERALTAAREGVAAIGAAVANLVNA